MTNLKNKKIIIFAIIILLILIIGALFIFKRTNKNDIIQSDIMIQKENQTRLMTDAEKELVNIDKNQQAEVVSDKAGLFVYKVVK